MTDKKSSSPAKVKVVMTVNSHNFARGAEVEVSKKVADRLIANNQARKA